MTFSDRLTDFRTSPVVRGTAQIAIIAVLLYVVYSVLNLERDAEEASTDAATVNELLATACGAATLTELREQNLLAECKLAQAKDLADKIKDGPDEEDPGSAIPDDPTPTNPKAIIRQVVDDYFAIHPLPNPDYENRIRRAVRAYIAAHPPKAGRDGKTPSEAQILRAVRTVVMANPPTKGDDGRGVVSSTLDGCNIVFTYTDGTADTIGPLCGPPPTDQQVLNAVGAYCAANDGCRGPDGVIATHDACDPTDGEFVTDVTLVYVPEHHLIRLICTTEPWVPGLPGDIPGPLRP